MKQFVDILKFELFGHTKSRLFIGITIGFIVIIGGLLSFPRFIGILEKAEEPTSQQEQILLVSDNLSKDNRATISLFQNEMQGFTVSLTDKNKEELSAQIANGEIAGAVIITAPSEYIYMVKKLDLHDNTPYTVDQIMLQSFRLNKMTQLGVDAASAKELLSTPMQSEVVEIAKGQMDTFFYTYILIFALYIAILLYGQKVAISVATEKSSRAMEMLITSAKPTSLMFGKVIGAGLAGLMQMTAILLGGAIFWVVNRDLWQDNAIINSIFDMPPYLLCYMLLFFVLGFFIYAFLYGAVGSLASRVEDINTSSTPITFLFIAAFMIVMVSMMSGNVDNIAMVIASYLPFTSPMAMFVRISMSEVAPLEIILSVSILILSTVGIGYLAAKIYRVGVLLYGTPPKLSAVMKAMKK